MHSLPQNNAYLRKASQALAPATHPRTTPARTNDNLVDQQRRQQQDNDTEQGALLRRHNDRALLCLRRSKARVFDQMAFTLFT
ncbi:hypothetical protein [Gemmatimonas sp.]|uniref:hypothetical protein n=1 Tax=Gemmatimonas sp. TaxID=1962908 RepID=UPI0031C9D312|nr:hypothetical protein [Gemmatimonas sp.]